jgi:hypothetical protein
MNLKSDWRWRELEQRRYQGTYNALNLKEVFPALGEGTRQWSPPVLYYS